MQRRSALIVLAGFGLYTCIAFGQDRQQLLDNEPFHGTKTYCVEITPLKASQKQVALHFNFTFPDRTETDESRISTKIVVDADPKKTAETKSSYTEGFFLLLPGQHHVVITVNQDAHNQTPLTKFSLFTIRTGDADSWGSMKMCK